MFDALSKNLDEATTGFKQMQIALLIFAGATVLMFVIVVVKLLK